ELAEKAKIIVQDCVIETDLEILIPETYVSNVTERLQLYSRLDNLKDEEQLNAFSPEIRDRFGPIPTPVDELINSVRLRWLGEELGFEKLGLKGERLRGFCVSGKESYFRAPVFGAILRYVQRHPGRFRMRDHTGKAVLLTEQVPSVDTAISILDQMRSAMISSSEILSK